MVAIAGKALGVLSLVVSAVDFMFSLAKDNPERKLALDAMKRFKDSIGNLEKLVNEL